MKTKGAIGIAIKKKTTWSPSIIACMKGKFFDISAKA